MSTEYELSYTGQEIDEKLQYVDNLMKSDEGGYATEQFVNDVIKQEISSQVNINTWVDIENEQIIGKLAYGNVGKNITIADNTAGRYTMIDVSEYTKIKASGYQWATSYGYHMVSFVDAVGKVLSVYTPDDNTYAECELDVPDDAKFAYITGNIAVEISVSGYKFYNIEVLAEEKADKYAAWVNPNKTVTEAKIAYDSGNMKDESNARCITVEVAGYQKVRCLGYQFSKTYYSTCMFYDKNGALISAHKGETESARASFELKVPTNAYTFKMNSHKNLAGIEYIELFKPMSIKELYNDLKPIGRKLITLGDSITALSGNTGWVNYFIEKTGCTLIANVAVNGACLNDKDGTIYDGNPVFNGADENVNNVLGNQVQKIINNGYDAPDIIMIAIGTNSGIYITEEQIKSAYYDSNNVLIPLENVDRTKSAGAYRWCLDKLHETYPNAIIFWCTPIMGAQTVRSAENAMSYAESLRIATEYTGQVMIDTIRCGINGINEINGENGQYLIDGLHPNINGARKIGYYNASKVMPFLGNNFELI